MIEGTSININSLIFKFSTLDKTFIKHTEPQTQTLLKINFSPFPREFFTILFSRLCYFVS